MSNLYNALQSGPISFPFPQSGGQWKWRSTDKKAKGFSSPRLTSPNILLSFPLLSSPRHFFPLSFPLSLPPLRARRWIRCDNANRRQENSFLFSCDSMEMIETYIDLFCSFLSPFYLLFNIVIIIIIILRHVRQRIVPSKSYAFDSFDQ